MNRLKTYAEETMESNAKPIIKPKIANELARFLFNHKINKEDGNVSPTNTRIGDGANIYSGKFYIPDSDYPEFLRLYHDDIVSKHKDEYLTESQLKTNGPILVDLDFRFSYETDQRQYSKDHIDDMVMAYLEELKTMYQFDESTRFSLFVQEKPHINRLADKQITKDGIHLIIGINTERKAQIVLRKRMVAKLEEIWGGEGGLPLTNTFDEVLDEGISQGHTNWQLYGSGKPNHEKYALTYIYNIVGFDTADSEFQIQIVDVSKTPVPVADYMGRLSARCANHPTFFYTSSFAKTLNDAPDGAPKRNAGGVRNQGLLSGMGAGASFNVSVLSVRNADDLESLAKSFRQSIGETENELIETWDYTMALPASYYGDGSYSKWIRVGWALRNIDDRLFVVWVLFSAQAPKFNYGDIRDLYERWLKFDMKNPQGLTKRSIMHWAKEDAREEFLRIRAQSTDFAIERSLGSYETVDDGKADKRGSTDYDIASILFQLYKSDYVCSSITHNTWYKYSEPRWMKIDAGVYLRRHISNELRNIYMKKANQYLELRARLKEGDDAHKIKQITAYIDKITSIFTRLGQSNDKKNIMTEAKELFYNDRFEEKLDANPYLLCFKNGVVDFKTKEFRRGRPEDYLTKCTNIDYFTDANDAPKYAPIIAEIHDFMRKLFPVPELEEYMWQHLASVLMGVHPDQTWNIYIGDGQNGKSVLVKLMEHVLGEYKGIVPLSLLTDSRTKIGGTSPEVVGLVGLRYAVMQEPTKGQRVNEGVMKQLVSGIDPIQARGLYMQHAITFYPQFKLILCTNYLMDVKSNDHGTWRRIRTVPFMSLFTENPVNDDPERPYQFKAELGIEERTAEWKEVFASLLVLKAFQTEGRVKDCDIVLNASNEYRKSQDNVSEFVADCIVGDGTATIPKSELTSYFNHWIQENYGNSKAGPSLKDVVVFMDKKYQKDERSKTKGWMGCRLVDNRRLQEEVDDSDIEEIEDM